jgi:Flp pilus assembly pilin Flp
LSHTLPRRRQRRRDETLQRMRQRWREVARYKARSFKEWSRREQTGVAIVETALVLPLISLLLAGGLGLGLAVVADIRLEHAAGEAARGVAAGVLDEDGAAALVESAGGSLDCFDVGAGGACFDDGLEVDRVQVVASTVVVVPFIGDVTPTASAVSILGP